MKKILYTFLAYWLKNLFGQFEDTRIVINLIPEK